MYTTLQFIKAALASKEVNLLPQLCISLHLNYGRSLIYSRVSAISTLKYTFRCTVEITESQSKFADAVKMLTPLLNTLSPVAKVHIRHVRHGTQELLIIVNYRTACAISIISISFQCLRPASAVINKLTSRSPVQECTICVNAIRGSPDRISPIHNTMLLCNVTGSETQSINLHAPCKSPTSLKRTMKTTHLAVTSVVRKSNSNYIVVAI